MLTHFGQSPNVIVFEAVARTRAKRLKAFPLKNNCLYNHNLTEDGIRTRKLVKNSQPTLNQRDRQCPALSCII